MAVVNGVTGCLVILLCSINLSMQLGLDLRRVVVLLSKVLNLNTKLPFHFLVPPNQHLDHLLHFQHAVLASSNMWSWVNVSCNYFTRFCVIYRLH